LAVIALDIELAQILRFRALVIGDFENDLVLVDGLLDQVAVVLGISKQFSPKPSSQPS